MFSAYLKYRRKAIGRQGIHSPFVYSFYNEILKNKDRTTCKRSKQMLLKVRQDRNLIATSNFGAKASGNEMTSVASIARKSGVNYRWGCFLYHMSQHHGGKRIVELGTNLGLSTAFLCEGNSNAEVLSFEGNPEFVKYADGVLKEFGFENYQIRQGLIQDNLQQELERLNSVDLVYIDADHTYEATMQFFKMLLPYAHQKTIFIFDDIYWSTGMTKAWQEIIAHPDVVLSMDLFFKGVITFDQGVAKQDFVLKH